MLLVHNPGIHAQPAEAIANVTPELIQAVRVADATRWRTLLSKESAQQRDFAGNTALHFAALNHDLEAVHALLAAGADANVANTAAATPLLYGAGHSGIVAALLEHGANPNAISAAGGTPLMAAVAHPESFDAVRVID